VRILDNSLFEIFWNTDDTVLTEYPTATSYLHIPLIRESAHLHIRIFDIRNSFKNSLLAAQDDFIFVVLFLEDFPYFERINGPLL
jgi:hypothetical protein